jgi:PIN domain nuclease of toxin-antitoxin system
VGRTPLILLDTHVVVWLSFAEEKISPKARRAIDSARKSGEGLAISDITLLELATLVRKGRIRPTIGLEAFLAEVEARFVVLPMTGRVCARAMSFPESYPNDPADRIIGAMALVEGITLLTADRNVVRSGVVQTLW